MPTETFTPGDLLCNDYPVQTMHVVLTTGTLERGAVLGRITASGKYKLAASASTDGSEVPALVLAVPTDASAGEVTTSAYVSGAFDRARLIYGAGIDDDATEAAFRKASAPMFVKKVP